jgi:hypothetical protein
MEMPFLSLRGTVNPKSYLDSIGMLRHRAKAYHCNSGIGRMMTLALFFAIRGSQKYTYHVGDGRFRQLRTGG